VKQVIIFLTILISVWGANAQTVEIREGKISPNKNLIAFIGSSKSYENDILLYDLSRDTLSRITYSMDLNYGLRYKTNLNWIDNEKILFLSKQNGRIQQYILDLSKSTLEPNGSSSFDEYFLNYSPQNEETYYISSINGKEPAVYRRKLFSDNVIKITKGNENYSVLALSPNSEYLSYRRMPMDNNTIVYSLKENQKLKCSLPHKEVAILAWSPLCDKFIYQHIINMDNSSSKLYLKEYDITSKTSKTIHSFIGKKYTSGAFRFVTPYTGSLWFPCKDKYLFSFLDKLYIVDTDTQEKKEYTIAGKPIDWVEECVSVLFIHESKAFIFNIETEQIKEIIN
jgi:Tol biopolymer transport system component